MDDYGYYFTRGNKKDSYNFDLSSHMKLFDLYEFCLNDNKDKYGFLVITPEKYYLGYNARFGEGTHYGAFARVMKEENGGGYIFNEEDAARLSNACCDKYITASLINECRGRDFLLEHENRVYICFELGDKKFNQNFINIFTNFYNYYSHEISFLANHFGFKVYFSYYDKDKMQFDISNNLDNLYKYIMSRKDVKIKKRVNNG